MQRLALKEDRLRRPLGSPEASLAGGLLEDLRLPTPGPGAGADRRRDPEGPAARDGLQGLAIHPPQLLDGLRRHRDQVPVVDGPSVDPVDDLSEPHAGDRVPSSEP